MKVLILEDVIEHIRQQEKFVSLRNISKMMK